MMRKLKFAALMIPAAVMALLCGCGLWQPIEPMFEDRVVELPPDATGTTTPETTTETTTTTDVYTPDADEDLREMVASMTLRERIGQLLLVSCSDEFSAKYAAEQGAGGLCLFAPVFQWKTADDVRTMTESFQSGANIPMLISVDEEGGTVNRVSLNGNLRETPFESPRALNEQGGLNRIENDTKEKAQFLLDLGINVNLAPVCDVPEEEGNFIYPRSYSTDAKETAEYVRTVIGVMNTEHLGSCLKHFPGYGGSSDTHYGMAWDKRELDMFEKNDFLPFKAGIDRTGRLMCHAIIHRRRLARRLIAPIGLEPAIDTRSHAEALLPYRFDETRGWDAMTTGVSRWADFCAQSTEVSCVAAEEYLAAILELRDAWVSRFGRPNRGSAVAELLGLMPGCPVLGVRQSAALIGRSLSSVNEAFLRLEAAGIVASQEGLQRNRVYVAPEAVAMLKALERRMIPNGPISRDSLGL